MEVAVHSRHVTTWQFCLSKIIGGAPHGKLCSIAEPKEHMLYLKQDTTFTWIFVRSFFNYVISDEICGEKRT